MSQITILVEGDVSSSAVREADQICRIGLGQPNIKIGHTSPGLAMDVSTAASVVSALAAVASLLYAVVQDRRRATQDSTWSEARLKSYLDAELLKLDVESDCAIQIENYQGLSDQNTQPCIVYVETGRGRKLVLSVADLGGHFSITVKDP